MKHVTYYTACTVLFVLFLLVDIMLFTGCSKTQQVPPTTSPTVDRASENRASLRAYHTAAARAAALKGDSQRAAAHLAAASELK